MSALCFSLSCTKRQSAPEDLGSGTLEKEKHLASAASVEEGRRVYHSNCIACHAVNPHRAGSLGPALAGSSVELLQLRLIQGRYPEGYIPKQKTGQMPLFPHLRNQIPSLQLFLAQEEAAYSSR